MIWWYLEHQIPDNLAHWLPLFWYFWTYHHNSNSFFSMTPFLPDYIMCQSGKIDKFKITKVTKFETLRQDQRGRECLGRKVIEWNIDKMTIEQIDRVTKFGSSKRRNWWLSKLTVSKFRNEICKCLAIENIQKFAHFFAHGPFLWQLIKHYIIVAKLWGQKSEKIN